MTERSRKHGVLLAALILALILALAGLAGSFGAPSGEPASPSTADAGRARRRRAAHEHAVTLEPSGAGLVVRADPKDAGVRLVAEPAEHPVPRGRYAYDTCHEPLPQRADPPEGLEVIRAEHVSVAFHRDWLAVDAARDIARDANQALVEAAELIGWPARQSLLVVTYPTREAMAEAVGLPPWSAAAYNGAVHLVVESYARSLRHEIMHAQLHATAPCVPYWLDEGLASYFEREPWGRALHWLRMIHAHMWIPFASLAELLGRDEGAEQMETSEVALLYAQSLAMVTMLADEGGPRAIEQAVARSREGVPRHDAWDLAMPGVGGEELLRYLARLLFPDLSPAERDDLRGRAVRCWRGEAGLPACEPHDG